jgi:hypothetical protein
MGAMRNAPVETGSEHSSRANGSFYLALNFYGCLTLNRWTGASATVL